MSEGLENLIVGVRKGGTTSLKKNALYPHDAPYNERLAAITGLDLSACQPEHRR